MKRHFEADVDESGRFLLHSQPAADACGRSASFNVFSAFQKGTAIMRRPFSLHPASHLLGILPIFAMCLLMGQNTDAEVHAGEKAVARIKLAHPEVPRIPAKELVQLLKARADIIIVDTQAADGYEMWHIPTAVNIPYSSTADPMDRQLMLVALPMDRQIVIYCLCEEGTDSAKMALEMRQLGFSDKLIRVLEGGLVLWDEKGYPMVKQKIPE